MPFLRRCANVALALVLSVFAVAPHQHDGLAETLFQDTVTQIGVCETPNAAHYHAAKATHAHPCVACARQHSAGTFRAVAVAGARPVAVRRHAIAIARTAAPSLVFTPLRGPPA